MKSAPFFLTLCIILNSCNQSIKYSVASRNVGAQGAKGATSAGIIRHDGKCFQNCIIPDQYSSTQLRFPVYVGADPDAPLRRETIVVEPAKTKWEKKNDGSLCLVELPAVTRTITVLADTLFYRDFRYETLETQTLVKKGGFLRETQVLCADERTPNLFLQLSSALQAYGYMKEAKAEWDLKFSQAIQQFQKDNSLPVGDLNMETLEFLGM